MPIFVPASLSIVHRLILVPDILSIIAHLLSFLQFKVAFDMLLARALALEQFSRTHESQKAALMFEIRHMVTELVRLSTLDPSLSEERRFCSRPWHRSRAQYTRGGGATRRRRRVTSRQTAELLRGGVTGRSG